MIGVDPALLWIAILAAASIFAGSALMKLADLAGFTAAVENYRILPRWAAPAFACAVPALELGGALGCCGRLALARRLG